MTPSRPGASLVTQRLSTHVAMLVWDDPNGGVHRQISIDIGGSPVRPPISRVTLPVEGGGVRMLIALRPESAEGPVGILDRDGAVLASIDAEEARAGDGEFDPFHLIDRLDGTGKVRLARFLLELTRTVFQLDTDPFYVVNMRHLVDALCPAPGPVFARATVGDDLILCEAGVSDGVAPLQTAVTVARRRISRAPFEPLADDGRVNPSGVVPAWLMLRPDAAGADRMVVIFGRGGFAVRRPAPMRAAVPSVIDWRPETDSTSSVARRYVLDCLGYAADDDASAAALAREIAAFEHADRSAAAAAPAVSLAVGACVATRAGLFVAGRLADRHGLVQGIAVRGAGFEAALPLERLACLGGDARRHDGLGFVALAATPGRAPKPNRFHFELRLHSGAVVDAAAVSALDTGAAARAAILAAVPDEASTPSVIDRIVGPALDGIDGAVCDHAAPEIVAFGAVPDSPRATVIMPFGRDRAPLLARAGALCTDRAAADLDLIYVLDRPAARAGAERALSGLWQTFGLSGRLLCVAPSDEPSAAMTNAAAAARSEQLVFLGEWAVPDSPGGLRPLLDVLAEMPDVGLCGARVLSPDGSIRSAGLELVSTDDAPSLDAPHRGLPGDFVAASAARDVFAVSGTALAIRRALFVRIGGVGAGYVTADWRDADLAARVRADGACVRFVPQATLTDFADAAGPRRSVALHADAWRFGRRWSARLDEWVGTGAPGAEGRAVEPGDDGPDDGPDDNARWAA